MVQHELFNLYYKKRGVSTIEIVNTMGLFDDDITCLGRYDTITTVGIALKIYNRIAPHSINKLNNLSIDCEQMTVHKKLRKENNVDHKENCCSASSETPGGDCSVFEVFALALNVVWRSCLVPPPCLLSKYDEAAAVLVRTVGVYEADRQLPCVCYDYFFIFASSLL